MIDRVARLLHNECTGQDDANGNVVYFIDGLGSPFELAQKLFDAGLLSLPEGQQPQGDGGRFAPTPPADGARCDVYVRFSDEPVKRTHSHAADTINVDVDENGVPVGVELVGAQHVQINGQSITPAPSFPEGDCVDRVSRVLRGYRIKLGVNALSLIKDGHWHSVPLSLGEMRDIAWLLQEAGLLRDHQPEAIGEADKEES